MSESNWATLAPPLELPAGEGDFASDDTRPDDGPICPVCGEIIYRDPTWKRMHKYHDGCTPNKGKSTGGSNPRTGGSGYPRKAEQEADECERILKAAFIKLALAVSVVDRYDAFCIMVNTPGVCSSFRGVCLRYSGFRKEILAVKSGGSIAGLVIALIFTVAPMLAHHGLVPSKTVAEAMVKLPILLYQLAQRMREGQEGLTVMMEEYMRQMREDDEKRQRAEQARRADANGQYVGPSPN